MEKGNTTQVIENKTENFISFHEKANIKIHEALRIQEDNAHRDGRIGGFFILLLTMNMSSQAIMIN